jgi:WD40 repeat protein
LGRHASLLLIFYFLESNIHKNCIYDLIWLNKTELACGGGDKIVNIVDTNTFDIKSVLKGHTESVKTITCVKTNTSIIASGSRDGSILIYDLRYNKKSTDEAYHSINTIQAAHYNAGQMPSTPKTIKIHNNNNTNNNNNNNISPIACVLFQNEHLIISAGATDNLIKVWDLRKTYTNRLSNPQPLISFKNDVTTKGYSNLVLTNCNTRLFANCMNNSIYEFDLCSYKCVNELQGHKNSSNFVKSCLSIDDNFLLTGSSDSNAFIYPLNYKNRINVIKLESAHQNEVTCVAWSPHDINQLMTCSDDNSIRVWNVKHDLRVIEKQENLFKSTEIEVNNKNLPTNDDNIKLFNQKFYFNQQFSCTSVYNDILFTNYQNKFDLKYKKTLLPVRFDEGFNRKNVFSLTSNLPSNLNNVVLNKNVEHKVCKQILGLVQTRIPFRSNENTTPLQHKQQNICVETNSTSKKRPLDKIFSDAMNLNAQTPQSKRRLILDSRNNIQTVTTTTTTATKSILDYFSPKFKNNNNNNNNNS